MSQEGVAIQRALLHRLGLLGLLLLSSLGAWYLDPASHAAAQEMTARAPAQSGTAVRDCGVETVIYGRGHAARLRECLWRAYRDGASARFESRATLVGSTIIYRVHIGPGEVRLVIDPSGSLYGPREVATFRCTGLHRHQVGEHLYFRLQGCPTIRIFGF
ncbi:MAG: hypothetical protein ACOY93_17335 [Bacillota bacterium]